MGFVPAEEVMHYSYFHHISKLIGEIRAMLLKYSSIPCVLARFPQERHWSSLCVLPWLLSQKMKQTKRIMERAVILHSMRPNCILFMLSASLNSMHG